MVTALVFHELGHYMAIYKTPGVKIQFFMNKGPVLRTGPLENVPKEDLKGMYILGILAGLVPIIIGGIMVHTIYMLLIAPYMVGCLADIQEFVKKGDKNVI